MVKVAPVGVPALTNAVNSTNTVLKGKQIMTAMSKIFLFSVLSAVHLYASADDFTVGEITVPRGERVSGFITVPAGTDDGTTIPVTIVHGASDGPVLALIAGIHGYEYPHHRATGNKNAARSCSCKRHRNSGTHR